ncbi:MAG: prolipoprotein diacylglyceryl transferase [Candidatus Omnitrophica bacterium]|nr:prolipoprotein diacylglyceryl transferase [Candidatus Omnitrophota bacterium]
MFPVICQIGPLAIYSYGLMLALAVFVSARLLAREARVIGIEADTVYDLVFWVVISGIVGARIFYILLNLGFFIDAPFEILMLQKGGLAWQGSFAGGLLAGLLFIRRRKLALWPLLDIVAPYIALGSAIGRIGCLLNGCCYGRAADWGLYFPAWGERLVPTQIFMSAGQLLIFLILRSLVLASRARPDGARKIFYAGRIFILYLMLSSLERFGVEFWRADHVLYWGLSIFQYVSLVVFVVALGLHRRLSLQSIRRS